MVPAIMSHNLKFIVGKLIFSAFTTSTLTSIFGAVLAASSLQIAAGIHFAYNKENVEDFSGSIRATSKVRLQGDECDVVKSSEVDTGILGLGCGEGTLCVLDETSSIGGRCVLLSDSSKEGISLQVGRLGDECVDHSDGVGHSDGCRDEAVCVAGYCERDPSTGPSKEGLDWSLDGIPCKYSDGTDGIKCKGKKACMFHYNVECGSCLGDYSCDNLFDILVGERSCTYPGSCRSMSPTWDTCDMYGHISPIIPDNAKCWDRYGCNNVEECFYTGVCRWHTWGNLPKLKCTKADGTNGYKCLMSVRSLRPGEKNNACLFPENVGCNSCAGNRACYGVDVDLKIGEGSCRGEKSCARAYNDVPDGARRWGWYACCYSKGFYDENPSHCGKYFDGDGHLRHNPKLSCLVHTTE